MKNECIFVSKFTVGYNLQYCLPLRKGIEKPFLLARAEEHAAGEGESARDQKGLHKHVVDYGLGDPWECNILKAPEVLVENFPFCVRKGRFTEGSLTTELFQYAIPDI